MRKFENFLFYYSILAVTIFFVSFGLFSPKPLNFISGVMLLPIVFYFWIRLTNPEIINADRWSLRFILSLIVISAIGIYGYYLSTSLEPTKNEETLKSQLVESLKKNEELKDRLSVYVQAPDTKEATPSAVEGESIADLIAQPAEAVNGTRIALIKGVESSNIYLEKDLSSKKIGSITIGITYPFIEKSGGWYKIVASGTQTGWVNESQVIEVQ